jgi:hypothetical protein
MKHAQRKHKFAQLKLTYKGLAMAEGIRRSVLSVKSSALWVDVNVSEDHAASIFRVK